MEAPEAVERIETGDEIEIDFSTGEIRNLTKGEVYHANPFPEFIMEIIKAGGLVEWAKRRLAK